MEKINQEDFKKMANKIGLFFILQMFLLVIITPIFSKIGIYNQSNGFIFNMAIIFIIACLLFPCDFKKMFLRKKKIYILEGILYVFIFLSIYFLLTIIISNLLSPLYPTTIVEEQFTMRIFILQGITIPIVEEMVFRGIILESLRKYGDNFAIVISALIFGMTHGFRSTYTFWGGIFTGILYVKSNQLSYSILMHMFINLFSILLISWISKFFQIENINIEFLTLIIISMTIAFVLYNIAKKKRYPEIENIKNLQIKRIIPQLKQDKERYVYFFKEGLVILALVVFYMITSMEIKLIISKLK